MGINYFVSEVQAIWANCVGNYCRKHIEELNPQWKEIDQQGVNTLEGGLSLYSTNAKIQMVKMVTNSKTYYFYRPTAQVLPLNTHDEDTFLLLFIFDTWNTFCLDFFKYLESRKALVFSKTGFKNRFLVKNQFVSFNLTLQTQYQEFILEKNLSWRRKNLGFLNPADLRKNNNISDDAKVSFQRINQTDFPDENWSYADWDGSKPLDGYIYLKTKTSCFFDSNNQQAIPPGNFDFVFLIPPTNLTISDNVKTGPALFYSLLNRNTISDTFTFDFIAGGSNFIGFYKRDIPYSVVLAKSECFFYDAIDPSGVRDAKVRIYFFKCYQQQTINFNLYDLKDFSSGMLSKLVSCLNDVYSNKWEPSSEPLLLNPYFYQERISLDESKILLLDSSQFILNTEWPVDLTGTFLEANAVFENTGVINYSWGGWTNLDNLFYNNQNNNLRFEDANQLSLNTPNAQDYFLNNSSTLYTANENMKTQNEQNASSFSGSSVAGVGRFAADITTGIIIGAAVGSVIPVFGTALGAAAGAGGAAIAFGARTLGKLVSWENKRNEMNASKQINSRNFNSMVSNISNTPALTTQTPFYNSYFPNRLGLFELFTKELIEKDKLYVFNGVISNGYVINQYLPLPDLQNRVLMNIYDLDLTKNYDYLWGFWVEWQEGWEDYYFNIFLDFFSKKIRIWEENEIVNCTNFGYIDETNDLIVRADDYLDNCEKTNYPAPRIALNTLIPNDLLVSYYFRYKPNGRNAFVMNLISSFLDEGTDNLTITWVVGYCLIQATPENEDYIGAVSLPYKFQERPIDLNEPEVYEWINSFILRGDLLDAWNLNSFAWNLCLWWFKKPENDIPFQSALTRSETINVQYFSAQDFDNVEYISPNFYRLESAISTHNLQMDDFTKIRIFNNETTYNQYFDVLGFADGEKRWTGPTLFNIPVQNNYYPFGKNGQKYYFAKNWHLDGLAFKNPKYFAYYWMKNEDWMDWVFSNEQNSTMNPPDFLNFNHQELEMNSVFYYNDDPVPYGLNVAMRNIISWALPSGYSLGSFVMGNTKLMVTFARRRANY